MSRKSRHARLAALIKEARRKYPECKGKSDSYVRGWVKVAEAKKLKEKDDE